MKIDIEWPCGLKVKAESGTFGGGFFNEKDILCPLHERDCLLKKLEARYPKSKEPKA